MARTSLKEMISRGEFIQAPGVYDALSARIVEQGGFSAVYMTGYGTTATHFSFPDIGLITMTEMVETARRITSAVEIPLIADADTGYGNPINVVRTVREYEKAGVAAIHIEDQVWPKKCGHMDGKKIIDSSEMIGKIKAAVDARQNENFLIIARTDALAVEGFEKAIERGHRFAEAGADLLFIEAPVSREQVAEIPKLIPEKPLILNIAPRTPNFSVQEMKDMGYAVALYPGLCLIGAINGYTEEVKSLKETGKWRDIKDILQLFMDLNNFLGLEHYAKLEKRYKTDD
ncbi:MAG TPA: isocitrate lyase/PEP mutase family protein [Deltaproteobacteria bacterium]|nr:isocitrate lyase/PEP mutase family protein [Deltaproteobacteria bacterium]